MKILYVTTVGQTMKFFEAFIQLLREEDNKVDIACNENESKIPELYDKLGCKTYHISCKRNPLDFSNIQAIKQIRRIVEHGNYDIVHCHTPVASVCCRLACLPLRRQKVKVVYTAHGFHFFSGGPLQNWLVYYPIEWLLSWITDLLICITDEDYNRAKRHFHAKRTAYVHGVGVELDKYPSQKETSYIKKALNIGESEKIILSVGELNQNKDHIVIVKALRYLEKDVHYIIAGKGNQKDNLETIAREIGVESRLHLLGYREDIPELMSVADVFALPSLREGLNKSLMEAMASGIPCVCRRIRGNVDLIDNQGGSIVESEEPKAWAIAIDSILESDYKVLCGDYNKSKVKNFSMEIVLNELKSLYNDLKD